MWKESEKNAYSKYYGSKQASWRIIRDIVSEIATDLAQQFADTANSAEVGVIGTPGSSQSGQHDSPSTVPVAWDLGRNMEAHDLHPGELAVDLSKSAFE